MHPSIMFYPSINIYSSDHISTVHITGVHHRKPLNQNLLQHFRTDPIKQNAEILPQIWVSISHIKSRMGFWPMVSMLRHVKRWQLDIPSQNRWPH